MAIDSSRSDPSRLGTVEDVDGSSISIKLFDSTPGGLLFVNGEAYRVGQVGGFVRIPSGYVDLYGIISQVGAGAVPGPPEEAPELGNRWVRVELVGEGRKGTKFERGISQYPSVGDVVHVATESDLKAVYAPGDAEAYLAIGRVASAESIPAYVDLNRLISRHTAVLGSTGSGKSTAVANLLGRISDTSRFKSARVVLFDLHGEYASAFGSRARVFRIGANADVAEEELYVPFWALTADEFMALAMGPVNSAALPLVQELLLGAKRKSRPAKAPHGLADLDITLDTPLPFSVHKLWHDLYSVQYATHTVSENQNQSEATRAYAEGGTPVGLLKGDPDRLEPPQFKAITKEGQNRIFKGELSGLSRTHLDILESKLRDPRMRFLFRPGEWSVALDESTEADLDTLLAYWVGADNPITVFDLSGIPPSITDDMVGAILRILYDALFWGRMMPEGSRERPLLIVLEEAHVYLSAQTKGRAATAARRIAKEGRKYGIGLMLVSQRPSEIDSTILAQCGTTIALRLTNESDQSQVKNCASDNLKGLFLTLPILRTGEALVVGEAVNMPIRVLIDQPDASRRPNSDDPLVVVPKDEHGNRIRSGGWTESIDEEDYGGVVEAWRKQDPKSGSIKVTQIAH